jgi:glycosyltransferase involved in cell wall biosynthesis
MKVTVIIPTYNRAGILKAAVTSVLAQTFKDFELIVVDNYSSDDTEAVVNAFHDKRISYFKNQNNGLVSINRNFGIEKAQGECIALLDDDDLWLPEKLEKQIQLLDANKELGLVYSDCYVIDDSVVPREKTYFARKKPARGAAFTRLLQDNFIPILTVVIRQEALGNVGGFNPSYKIAQDYDLWLRIAQHYSIDFIDQPLGKYRVHGQSATSKNHILNYIEEMLIRNIWLAKHPSLKKELGGKLKALKYWPTFMASVGNILRKRNIKAIKESLGLIKFMCNLYTNRIKE